MQRQLVAYKCMFCNFTDISRQNIEVHQLNMHTKRPEGAYMKPPLSPEPEIPILEVANKRMSPRKIVILKKQSEATKMKMVNDFLDASSMGPQQKKMPTVVVLKKNEPSAAPVAPAKEKEEAEAKYTWTTGPTFLLIELYGDMLQKSREPGAPMFVIKTAMAEVSKIMREEHKVPVTGDQCCTKWKQLKAKFKAVKDAKNTSGNGAPPKFEFYDAMNGVLAGMPEITPRATASSYRGVKINAASGQDSDGSSHEPEPEALSPQERKRRKREEEAAIAAQEAAEKKRKLDEDADLKRALMRSLIDMVGVVKDNYKK